MIFVSFKWKDTCMKFIKSFTKQSALLVLIAGSCTSTVVLPARGPGMTIEQWYRNPVNWSQQELAAAMGYIQFNKFDAQNNYMNWAFYTAMNEWINNYHQTLIANSASLLNKNSEQLKTELNKILDPNAGISPTGIWQAWTDIAILGEKGEDVSQYKRLLLNKVETKSRSDFSCTPPKKDQQAKQTIPTGNELIAAKKALEKCQQELAQCKKTLAQQKKSSSGSTLKGTTSEKSANSTPPKSTPVKNIAEKPDSSEKESFRAEITNLTQQNIQKQSRINELESLNNALQAQLTAAESRAFEHEPSSPKAQNSDTHEMQENLQYYQERSEKLDAELDEVSLQLNNEMAKCSKLTIENNNLTEQVAHIKELADQALPIVQHFLTQDIPENHPLMMIAGILYRFEDLMGNMDQQQDNNESPALKEKEQSNKHQQSQAGSAEESEEDDNCDQADDWDESDE